MKKNIVSTIVLFIVLIFAWSAFIEPNMLVITNYNIKQNNLKGLKIVFVSDFHVNPYQKQNLKKLVKEVNAQNPDLILTTGDFVYGYNKNETMPIQDIAKELSGLKSKYGIYTVLGNHDWIQGGEEIEKALEANGIIVLGNENKIVHIKNQKIYIAGVEDITTRNIDLVKALNKISSPSILLTHSPDVFPFVTHESNRQLTDIVDLTLAGHTHGGQIVLPGYGPIIVPSDYGKKYASGLIKEKGKKMIVTKGIGNSILPLRFNCPPEIVVINFN